MSGPTELHPEGRVDRINISRGGRQFFDPSAADYVA